MSKQTSPRVVLLASVFAARSIACAQPPAEARSACEEHAGHEGNAEHAGYGDHDHDHDGHGATSAMEAAPSGSFQALAVPAADPSGPDRQVKVLLDAPMAKVVSIRLRNGATLPEHTSDLPVLIEAVAGSGTVLVGESRLPVDASRFVSLAPAVPHAVMPDAGSDLVLLVHHLRGGAPAR